MKKVFLSLILIWFCSSCASILTGKRSNIQIHTDKNLQLVVDSDTITRANNDPIKLQVRNNKLPLPIVVLDGGHRKILGVESFKPATYWLNAIPIIYLSGFLVDEITGLKWRYPRNIYIESDSNGIRYTPYIPMDESLLDLKNKITFAPFSIIHGYHPAFEFGYERLHGTTHATQVSLGIFRSWDNAYARDSRGFKASIEEKLYLSNRDKMRIYVAIALEYHHKEHVDDLNFEVIDSQGNTAFPRRTFIRLTTIEKRFLALTPRIGAQVYLTPRLVGEGFFGLGLRARRVRHNISNPLIRQIRDNDWFFDDTDYLSNRATRNNSLNFDLNFRLAWAF